MNELYRMSILHHPAYRCDPNISISITISDIICTWCITSMPRERGFTLCWRRTPRERRLWVPTLLVSPRRTSTLEKGLPWRRDSTCCRRNSPLPSTSPRTFFFTQPPCWLLSTECIFIYVFFRKKNKHDGLIRILDYLWFSKDVKLF